MSDQKSNESRFRYRRGPGLVWPFILIVAGVILLLNNLGYLPWDVWRNIWRFWPVFLILIGLEIILGRRGAWWRLFFWIPAILVILFLALFFSSGGPAFIRPWGEPGAPVSLDEPLGNLEEAVVELRLDAGRLEVGALPSDSDRLMAGDFRPGSSGEEPVKSFRLGEGKGEMRLSSRRVRPEFWGGWGSEWSIKLSPKVSLDLDVRSDVSRSDLDLSQLQLRRLSVSSDVSNSEITLPPPRGQVEVRIQGDVSRLLLELPPDAAARIESEGDISRVSLDESRFIRSGKTYTSGNYGESSDRLSIEIRGDISTVTVR